MFLLAMAYPRLSTLTGIFEKLGNIASFSLYLVPLAFLDSKPPMDIPLPFTLLIMLSFIQLMFHELMIDDEFRESSQAVYRCVCGGWNSGQARVYQYVLNGQKTGQPEKAVENVKVD